VVVGKKVDDSGVPDSIPEPSPEDPLFRQAYAEFFRGFSKTGVCEPCPVPEPTVLETATPAHDFWGPFNKTKKGKKVKVCLPDHEAPAGPYTSIVDWDTIKTVEDGSKTPPPCEPAAPEDVPQVNDEVFYAPKKKVKKVKKIYEPDPLLEDAAAEPAVPEDDFGWGGWTTSKSDKKKG